MNDMDIVIRSEEVMADIRSAGWLEQELHADADRHRRHQMADICEAGNDDRVWRVLGVAVAEVRLALLKILKPRDRLLAANELERPAAWTFAFVNGLQPDTLAYLKEKIHEYLVAAVMSERCGVILSMSEAAWETRCVAALGDLRATAASFRAALAPVRRPMWPF